MIPFTLLPDFGQILNFAVHGSDVCFVAEQVETWYFELLRAYEVVKKDCADILTIPPSGSL